MHSLNIRGELFTLEKPAIMGILNLTPDSFFAGSRVRQEDLVEQARRMLSEGAAIIDLGAVSTRPKAEPVSAAEEAERLLPAVDILHQAFPELPLSVDTFRPEIAEKALQLGAGIINDISGGQWHNEMFALAAQYRAPLVLMHLEGHFDTMHSARVKGHITEEVMLYLSAQAEKAKAAGVQDLILDPGFGFSKSADESYRLLHEMPLLQSLGYPVLAGVSRKRMVFETAGTTAAESLPATTALHMICLQKGAQILRVHDVEAARQCRGIYLRTQQAGKQI
ncbi:MAG: dihydropteroate synthase [Bacteroidia bacterium]|nr:dihydropteroate synthase [Bacteroidia bacterium]